MSLLEAVCRTRWSLKVHSNSNHSMVLWLLTVTHRTFRSQPEHAKLLSKKPHKYVCILPHLNVHISTLFTKDFPLETTDTCTYPSSLAWSCLDTQTWLLWNYIFKNQGPFWKKRGITNQSKLKTLFWRSSLEHAKRVFWKPVCKCKCQTPSKPDHITILSAAFHFAPKSPRETAYLLMVNAWLLASIALMHHHSVGRLSYARTNRKRCRRCFSIPIDAHSRFRCSALHRFTFLAFLPSWAVSAWMCYVCLQANTLFTQTIQA